MSQLQIHSNPAVDARFDGYPDHVRKKMMRLRSLVHEAAREAELVDQVEETLKWGEPSFVTRHGSTIRMDWKAKSPNQYAMYFQCTSQLVPSFKAVFGDLFSYEGNRAIVFQLDEEVPEGPLKSCMKAGLTYHKVKKLPMLGL